MWYVRHTERITLQVYVQPGAKLTTIAGLHGDLLKIRLNAPASEGQANAALQNYMAQLFEVSVKQVKLVRGAKSRFKTIEITGSSVEPERLFCF